MLSMIELYPNLPPIARFVASVFIWTWPVMGSMLGWAYFMRWRKRRMHAYHALSLLIIAAGGWVSLAILSIHRWRWPEKA